MNTVRSKSDQKMEEEVNYATVTFKTPGACMCGESWFFGGFFGRSLMVSAVC